MTILYEMKDKQSYGIFLNIREQPEITKAVCSENSGRNFRRCHRQIPEKDKICGYIFSKT